MSPANNSSLSPEGPDKAFQQFLANGEFKIQKCGDCLHFIFYPRIICPECGSSQLSWIAASGDGLVYSSSTPRGTPEGDYNISLIDLAEGPRMMSRVVGIPPEDVAIGMKVSAFIGEIDGAPVVLFKPTETSQ